MNQPSPSFNILPITLEGRFIRLEPLRREHAPQLWDAMKNDADEIFRWIPYLMRTAEDSRNFVELVLAEQERRVSIPFATVERSSEKIVGSTRFMSIDAANRHVEIGSTWIAPPWQRTAVNTEAKYLMLRHAFETWKCMRVEFKTDLMNEKSRKAILRLGAKEEGTFRKHMVTWNGRIRDSVYFSIIDTEWPEVKARLEAKLGEFHI
jgi:RimJ/RimL family protein N-acetyltransferase